MYFGDFMEEDIIVKIHTVLDKIRPFLINDGGNVEFVKYEDNILYIRLTGACQNCSLIDFTLNDGIKELFLNEIPEIKDVINV